MVSKNPTTNEYAYTMFDQGWSNFTACGIDYSNPPIPPNVVAMIHTQPFEIGEIPYPCTDIQKSKLDAHIQAFPALRDRFEYKGTPSPADVTAAAYFKSQKPGIKSYLVDKDGITEYDEQSPTDELGNSPRHEQNCYQN